MNFTSESIKTLTLLCERYYSLYGSDYTYSHLMSVKGYFEIREIRGTENKCIHGHCLLKSKVYHLNKAFDRCFLDDKDNPDTIKIDTFINSIRDCAKQHIKLSSTADLL